MSNLESNAQLDIQTKTVFYRPQIVKTKDLRIPNQYSLALDGELRDFAFNEERAPLNKSKWRSEIFKTADESAVDLEIGTGNGVHFRERCRREKDRFLVGLELKFKPLVQTVRGMLRVGASNGRLCRAHAFNIDEIFADGELNNIYMQFPDPWTTPRKPKNRMVNPRMVGVFHRLQRPGSVFELKTDSEEYYRWSVMHFQNSAQTETPYECLHLSEDWHKDPLSQTEVKTQFEKLFSGQGLPIYYGLWQRQEADKDAQQTSSGDRQDAQNHVRETNS